MGIRIPSDSISYGRNVETPKYSDKKYVRCSRCGFICNSDRDDSSLEGSRMGWGTQQSYTYLNGSVAKNSSTVTVISTQGFPSSGSIYIYETGTGFRMNAEAVSSDRIDYTGTTATTFTGCTGVRAHSSGHIVRGEQNIIGGCPQCGTYLYNK